MSHSEQTNAESQTSVDEELVTPNVENRIRDIDAKVRTFVVDRPFFALAGAVAGGFLIGRLLSR